MGDCEDENLWRGRLHIELSLLEGIDAQLKLAEAKLEALGEADAQVKLLCTVPGVGRCLAETVVCHLDDVKRFKSAEQVSSYAGLVPKQMESGLMKRSGRITCRGPSLLRGMLIEVAWMVFRHNAWAREFVNRISRGVKGRKKIAIVALARKLLVILWAMLRDNRPWRKPQESTAAPAPA
jgi:transposase